MLEVASASSSSGDDDDDGLSALIGSSFARQAKRQRTILPDADAASISETSGKFAYALHSVTTQPTTGLGARLAGTSDPVDDLWLPTSLPWQPADASGSQPLPTLLPAALALRLELRRAARLAQLRARFVELCATTSLPSPPVNAFERWRFMCKWQEQGEPTDALLPTGPTQVADASFAADLGRLGVAPAAADQLVAAVRAASVDAADAVARLRNELLRGSEDGSSLVPPAVVSFQQLQGGVLRVRAAPATAAAAAANEAADQSNETELSVCVTEAAVQKLRALHARHRGGGCGGGGSSSSGGGEAATDAAVETTGAAAAAGFDARLLALLLRHEAIGGAGFQAALGGGVLRELQASLVVTTHPSLHTPSLHTPPQFTPSFRELQASLGVTTHPSHTLPSHPSSLHTLPSRAAGEPRRQLRVLRVAAQRLLRRLLLGVCGRRRAVRRARLVCRLRADARRLRGQPALRRRDHHRLGAAAARAARHGPGGR